MTEKHYSSLYFAYGREINNDGTTDLDIEWMQKRFPDAILFGKVILHNYRIAFRSPGFVGCGHPNLVQEEGAYVPGILWCFNRNELKEISKELTLSEFLRTFPVTFQGKRRAAFAINFDKCQFYTPAPSVPFPHTVDALKASYEACGFNTEPLYKSADMVDVEFHSYLEEESKRRSNYEVLHRLRK